MAKKKTKKAAVKVISASQREKINKALKSVENRILTNYKSAASVSGKSISKETKKVKKSLAVAKKRIEGEVRKNPAGATVAAAILGAVAGALIMSKLKKR
jgi:hypothetical protein